VIVAMAISPAIGGPGFLTTKRAKRIFVSKRQARATYARRGSVLPATGLTKLPCAPGER
jgi:hypothetical protein